MLESFTCLCTSVDACFHAAHGVPCNRANHVVARNSQGPLRTAERWEDLVRGGGVGGLGTPTGAFFKWWHSEIDLARDPRYCTQLCMCTFPSTNPLRALETAARLVGNQSVWQQSLLWVCEFRERVQLTNHMWEFGVSSLFIMKIKEQPKECSSVYRPSLPIHWSHDHTQTHASWTGLAGTSQFTAHATHHLAKSACLLWTL